ncbi:MAG: hypothetical protein V4713_09510 [Pseudomonadota bacterium]
MNVFVLLGLASLLAGCACIYYASPHQRGLISSLSAWPARVSAGVLLLLGLLAFIQTMKAITASFVFATTLMLLLVALPYVGALMVTWRRR